MASREIALAILDIQSDQPPKTILRDRAEVFDLISVDGGWLGLRGGGEGRAAVVAGLGLEPLALTLKPAPVRIWDSKRLRDPILLEQPLWKPRKLALSPDGRLMATTGSRFTKSGISIARNEDDAPTIPRPDETPE